LRQFAGSRSGQQLSRGHHRVAEPARRGERADDRHRAPLAGLPQVAGASASVFSAGYLETVLSLGSGKNGTSAESP
jgi:hypothetical protein